MLARLRHSLESALSASPSRVCVLICRGPYAGQDRTWGLGRRALLEAPADRAQEPMLARSYCAASNATDAFCHFACVRFNAGLPLLKSHE